MLFEVMMTLVGFGVALGVAVLLYFEVFEERMEMLLVSFGIISAIEIAVGILPLWVAAIDIIILAIIIYQILKVGF